MNIDDLSHNSFEEQWQHAFDDASMSPPDAVWERIELGLENDNIPPKPNNSLYYFGGVILTVILGLVIWFFSNEKPEIKSAQVVENKEIKQERKIENIVLEKTEKVVVKSKEVQASPKAFIPKKEDVEIIETEPEIVMQEPENQTRIITDSVDFISPITITQKVNSELANPTLNIPFQPTPYYEIPKPKPQKKSFWDKVRISGGVGGIYQP